MGDPAKNFKHLTSGSECPPLKPGVLRFYNMHYCPFCQRARTLLNFKSVEYDKVNIHLIDKPEWFMEINALGKVPSLQLDDRVMYESMIICDYLDEAYPDPPLYPEDPWAKAVDKCFIEVFASKVANHFHKIYTNPEDEEVKDMAENVKSGLDIFEVELDKRGTKFFFGDSPGMLDFAMFPWFERFQIAQKIFPDFVILSKERFAKLSVYMEAMYENESAKSGSADIDDHVKYLESHLAGKSDFDIGV